MTLWHPFLSFLLYSVIYKLVTFRDSKDHKNDKQREKFYTIYLICLSDMNNSNGSVTMSFLELAPVSKSCCHNLQLQLLWLHISLLTYRCENKEDCDTHINRKRISLHKTISYSITTCLQALYGFILWKLRELLAKRRQRDISAISIA